jgi:hypothetical protein
MGGLREKGIHLTDSGMRCCNPSCRAVLYVELMAAPDHEACFDCEPEQFREGWHPQVAELFERSGGRLPAHPVHCSEPCCRRREAA